ncbi:MAG: hypothetical protein F6K16_38295 [Symploca sp. SIO2B6]|nr:hypothetical protein [Symploca sp. SIO2B6]
MAFDPAIPITGLSARQAYPWGGTMALTAMMPIVQTRVLLLPTRPNRVRGDRNSQDSLITVRCLGKWWSDRAIAFSHRSSKARSCILD